MLKKCPLFLSFWLVSSQLWASNTEPTTSIQLAVFAQTTDVHVNIVGIPTDTGPVQVLPIAKTVEVTDGQIVVSPKHTGPVVISLYYPKSLQHVQLQCKVCHVEVDQLPVHVQVTGRRLVLSGQRIAHLDIHAVLARIKSVMNVDQISIKAHSWISDNASLSTQELTVQGGVCHVRDGSLEVSKTFEMRCQRSFFAPKRVALNTLLVRSRRAQILLQKGHIGLMSLWVNQLLSWLGAEMDIERWQGVVTDARLYSVLPQPRLVRALGDSISNQFNLFSLGQKHLPYFTFNEKEEWQPQTKPELRISSGYFSQITPKVLAPLSDPLDDGRAEKTSQTVSRKRL